MEPAVTADPPPSVLEIIFSFALTDLIVCGAGMLIFWNWTRENKTPPLWAVVSIAALAMLAYVGVVRYLWVETSETVVWGSERTPPSAENIPQPRIEEEYSYSRDLVVVLMFAIGFWTIPVAYYSHVFLTCLGARTVDRLTWLGVSTGGSDEFAEARELAVLGDIEGAVDKYRSYNRRRPYALFAASLLLEADGQYERAAKNLQEAIAECNHDPALWPKATFRLAKIYEKNIEDIAAATALLQSIVSEIPDSDHGEMARTALAKLRPGGDSLLEQLDATYATGGEQASGNDIHAVTLRCSDNGPDGDGRTNQGSEGTRTESHEEA